MKRILSPARTHSMYDSPLTHRMTTLRALRKYEAVKMRASELVSLADGTRTETPRDSTGYSAERGAVGGGCNGLG